MAGTKQEKIIQETEAGEPSRVVVPGGWVGRLVMAVTVCVCVCVYVRVCVCSCVCTEVQTRLMAAGVCSRFVGIGIHITHHQA